MRDRYATHLAAAAALLLLAGCSSGGSAVSDSPATSEAAPVETQAPQGPTADEIAAQTNTALLEGFGMDSYQDACGNADAQWVCEIAEVRAGNAPGFVEVQFQAALQPDEAAEYATNVMSLTCGQVPELQWVIAVDSSGVDTGQVMRSDVPLCK